MKMGSVPADKGQLEYKKDQQAVSNLVSWNPGSIACWEVGSFSGALPGPLEFEWVGCVLLPQKVVVVVAVLWSQRSVAVFAGGPPAGCQCAFGCLYVGWIS